MELQEKIATNTWDSIDDFLAVLGEMRGGKWSWMKNTKCKYVTLRVDMRDGGCIIKDRDGNRIDPKDLEYQFELPNDGGNATERSEGRVDRNVRHGG